MKIIEQDGYVVAVRFCSTKNNRAYMFHIDRQFRPTVHQVVEIYFVAFWQGPDVDILEEAPIA